MGKLVLTIKEGEYIQVGEALVFVNRMPQGGKGQYRMIIEAPDHVKINRQKVVEKIAGIKEFNKRSF